MGHLRESWWALVAMMALGVGGLMGVSIVWGILGGALIGGDSLLKLLRLSRSYPGVPLTWQKLLIYAEAIGLGIVAGVGVWACGAVLRVLVVS